MIVVVIAHCFFPILSLIIVSVLFFFFFSSRRRHTRSLCDWSSDVCSSDLLPLNGAPTIPGVTPQIADGLSSPSAWEYASGVSRQFGARASLRADLLIRNYVDFYMRQTDTTTGRVPDPTGRQFDLSLITNAPDGLLSRHYAGGTFAGTYRFGTKLDVGAN